MNISSKVSTRLLIAGGFYDPDGKGNGSFPDGITIHNGKVVHNNVGNNAENIMGFDQNGRLIIDKLSLAMSLGKDIFLQPS